MVRLVIEDVHQYERERQRHSLAAAGHSTVSQRFRERRLVECRNPPVQPIISPNPMSS